MVVEQQAEAYQAGIRYLARREHSRAELRRKLAGKGFAEPAVDAALGRLADAGLQSDERFAENFVRSALRRGQGAVKIRAALRQRGVDEDIAAALLDLGDAFWWQQAAAAIAKRFGSDAPADRREWAKRARFLAGRGFSADIAGRVAGASNAP